MVGDRFDLFNVYRYTHGEPEQTTVIPWADWRPEAHPDSAPPGWVPQLHKSLFDAGYLGSLFEAGGFSATVFHYTYPGEEHPLNLGAIAAIAGRGAVPSDLGSVRDCLARVPQIDRCVVLDSLRIDGSPRRAEGLLDYGARLAATPATPRPSDARARAGLGSWLRGLKSSSEARLP